MYALQHRRLRYVHGSRANESEAYQRIDDALRRGLGSVKACCGVGLGAWKYEWRAADAPQQEADEAAVASSAYADATIFLLFLSLPLFSSG